jgi:hypothetical protein
MHNLTELLVAFSVFSWLWVSAVEDVAATDPYSAAVYKENVRPTLVLKRSASQGVGVGIIRIASDWP